MKYIRTIAQDNTFDSRTVNKLLYKHKMKQNVITVLETQKANSNYIYIYIYIYIKFTYTGNETTKLAKLFKQTD